MVTIQERVESGAKLLDVQRPGWDSLIDIAQLDIASTSKCILGQVYGTYAVGVKDLGIDGRSHEYGFTAYPHVADVNSVWRELIAFRRMERVEAQKSEPVLVGANDGYC